MARNISSSSSQEKDTRVCRYECPADFVPLEYSSSEKSVLERRENTELWLIKAPARFNPSSLADMKLSLSGFEMIQTPGASSQIYSVLSNRSGPTDLHLLTASGKKQNASLCASGFTGIVSISESYGDCGGNQSPIPVPAAPAPSIPPGLKQRFQPFGSSTSAHVFQSTTSTSIVPPKKPKLESEDTEDQRKKKKKKKKKEKHNREETTEVDHIKQEEIHYEYGEQQVPGSLEEDAAVRKKKMKKEKKEKDLQDEVAVDASLIVKQEPLDTSFNYIESSVKKKKKKKKKTAEHE